MSARDWFWSGGRLRAGWRILAYLALLTVLSVAGQYAASVLPRDPMGWVGLLIGTTAALMAGWLMLVRVDGRPPGALGFSLGPAAVRELGWGLALGVALNGAAVLLLLVSNTARWASDDGTWAQYLGVLAWTLLFFGLAAAYEELIFRGYPFQALVEGIGAAPATVLMSLAFAWAHHDNPNADWAALANIFLAGVLLSVSYLRTRSLWFATALHAGWNWAMAALFGFPVSGLTMFDTPLYDAVERGADWWTGGAFGPEAGLAGTLALVAGSFWLLRTRRVGESPRMRAMEPLVDRTLAER